MRFTEKFPTSEAEILGSIPYRSAGTIKIPSMEFLVMRDVNSEPFSFATFRQTSGVPQPLGQDPNGYADYREASAIVNLCENSIRNRLDRNSPYFDATFPRPRRLGPCKQSAIRFIRGQLYAWAANRPEA